MASQMSHTNLPSRLEPQGITNQRLPSSRLPTRSITPNSFSSKDSIPAPTSGKLHKKKPIKDTDSKGYRKPTRERDATIEQRTVLPLPVEHKRRLAPSPAQINSSMSSTRLVPQSTNMRPQYTNTRTPSLVSGSSASTVDSPRSVLRRKASSIGRTGYRPRRGSASSQEDTPVLHTVPGHYTDPFADSVFGISLPPTSTGILKQTDIVIEHSDNRDDEHENSQRFMMESLPHPNPAYASATPSTGYSESPTIPSQASTPPTLLSSPSPALPLSQKSTRAAHTSPLQSRPPIARFNTAEREQRALSSVRESSASSSSGSTVRHADGTKSRNVQGSRLIIQAPGIPVMTRQQLIERPVVSIPPPRSSSFKSPETQNPPELAHLAIDNTPAMSHHVRKPSRPSRDGTPELANLQQHSPIIQSNMSSLPARHRRGSSTDSRIGLSPLSAVESVDRLPPPSKGPSRNPSPSIASTHGASNLPKRMSARGPTPELTSDTEKSVGSATAPSPSKSGPRFGFFRRTKTEAPPAPKLEKKLRKGPMAGTGHEGYGKYANRGRSGSSTSGTSQGHSPSSDGTSVTIQQAPSSRKSSFASPKDSDVDDYFRERLAPVIIRGGSADICRTPDDIRSASSLDSGIGDATPDPNSNTSSYTSDLAVSVEALQAKPTLLPSALPDSRAQSPMKRFGFGFRRPSDSEDEKKAGFMPSNSRRASKSIETKIRKMKQVPVAINTAAMTSVLPLGSARSGAFSASETSNPKDSMDLSEGKEGNWLKAKKADVKKEVQAPKPAKKWTFWQRAAAQAPIKRETTEPTPAVVKAPVARSVAHYALDDGDDLDLNDIGRIMAEAVKSSDNVQSIEQVTERKTPELTITTQKPKQHVPSMLLPSPPLLPAARPATTRSASPKVKLSKDHTISQPERPQAVSLQTTAALSVPLATPITAKVTGRDQVSMLSNEEGDVRSSNSAHLPTSDQPLPNRLAQIGRIPRVISKRDQDRKLSDNSFSRPFVPTQPRPTVSSIRTSIDSVHGPLIAESNVLSDTFPALGSPFNQAVFDLSPLGSIPVNPNGEFFRISPRKMSEQSCSSSSGIWSLPAVVPSHDAPLSEDEVWNEYNEFIDEVLSPATDSVVSPSEQLVKAAPLDIVRKTEQHKSIINHSAHTSISSNPQSVHLRRSRLLSALNVASPKSSIAVSEVYSSFGDQNINIVDPVTGRLSIGSQRDSADMRRSGSIRTSFPNARASKSTISSEGERRRSSRFRDTKLIEMAENEKDGLENMANLRLAALMTSKWLSFGHVLFSPINLELKDTAEDNVLVIDGLGKDWSHYCALTYSEATIYNLSTSPAEAPNNGPLSGGLPNHRSIHHTSLMSAFPFPRGFFAAVVYRFPLAHPEAVYRHAIHECKRVLRPGGYLEMSVLDLDFVNMGNRGRRAVRSLKVQMQTDEPAVCLSPVSDMVMKFVHRRGFQNVKSCIVAVPVAAGRLSFSSSETSDAEPAVVKSAKALGKQKVLDPAQIEQRRKDRKEKRRVSHLAAPQTNFHELLNAPPSPDPAAANEANAKISSEVARVGRWWHSRCYENLAMLEEIGSQSLWSDGSLLRECEKRGTGFRLLVAFAQKPESTVRRTASV